MLVDMFCYLSDMLNEDGDPDAAVKPRIQIGWNELGKLEPLLTNMNMSLIMREIVQ